MHGLLLLSAQKKVKELWRQEGILHEHVRITARTLSTEEAIGNPESDDFPLQQGKERLMEAEFRGARGQAFTDRFGDYNASLDEIAEMGLHNNFRRALFVAACNAVQRYLGKTDRTVHCRDAEPGRCALRLADYIMQQFGDVRITQIGYQPKMIESLAGKFRLRAIDLDPGNIGSQKYGITIEGPENTQDAIGQADILLVTGSTIVNGTLDTFLLQGKPTIFYGTTIAAIADLLGLTRFCCESK